MVTPLLAAGVAGAHLAATVPATPAPANATPALRIDVATLFAGVVEIASTRTVDGTVVALEGIDSAGSRSIKLVRVGSAMTVSSLPHDPIPAEGLFLARRGDQPCVGTNSRGTPRVECLEGERWAELPFSGLNRTGTLTGLDDGAEGPAALVVRGDGTRAGYTVMRWNRDRWEQVGSSLRLPRGSIAALGRRTHGVGPVVGISPGPSRRGVRRVVEFHAGRWSDIVRPAAGRGGPVIGGPVVDGPNVWMAENTRGTGSDTRSRFTVLRWRRGGAPRRVAVSSGTADAQGTISLVDGQLWASWRGSRQAGTSLLGYHVTTNIAKIDSTSQADGICGAARSVSRSPSRLPTSTGSLLRPTSARKGSRATRRQ